MPEPDLTAELDAAEDIVMGRADIFYLLACLECGDPERPLPMPFGGQAERGKWASAHTKATGHDRWRVWTEVRQQREGSGDAAAE